MGNGESKQEPDKHQVKRLNGDGMCNKDRIKRPQPALHYLPLEIWNVALCKIDDPHDILRCGEVCYEWESLLQHKIMPAYHQIILPKLVPFLGASDLLNCSAVSKSWNNFIDTSVMNYRKASRIWYLRNQIFEPARLPRLYVTEGISGDFFAADIDPYLAAKEEFAGNQFDNPLVYRHVFMDNTRENDNEPPAFDIFCDRLLRFLQRFGHYIYQLELQSQSNQLVQLIQMMSICLKHTPKLEVFSCNFGEGAWEGDIEDEHLVDQYIAASPLPDSTIQKLRLDDCPPKLTEIMLERYGNQLVYVHDFIKVPVLELIPKGVTFQNLKILQSFVVGCTAHDGRVGLTYIANLIPMMKCTLTEVDIDVIVQGPQLNYFALKLSFTNFLATLQQHQPQVETLALSLTSYTVEHNPIEEHLDAFPLVNLESVTLSNLKRLTLDQVGLPPFQVFKKATPVLEHLTIYNKENYQWKFPSGKADEVWNALPKCKMVRLGKVKRLHFRPGNPPLQDTHLLMRK